MESTDRHSSVGGRSDSTLRRVPGPSRDALAVAFGACMVAILTQGTVTTFWRRITEPWAEFHVPSAITATYLGLYALVAYFIGTSAEVLRQLDSLRLRLVGLLCGLVALSFLWSTTRPVTMTSAVGLTGAAACAVWLTSRLSFAQRQAAVFLGLQIGLVASRLAIHWGWENSVNSLGDWAGVYLNRNSLAPVASVALLSSLFVFANVVKSLRSRSIDARWAGFAMIGVAIADVNALTLLVRSRSYTSVFALAAAGGILAVALIARRLRLPSIGLAGLLLGAGAAGLILEDTLTSQLTNWAQRSDGFSGRVRIWQIVWKGVQQRPVLGFGFEGAWWYPPFRTITGDGGPNEGNVFAAHNGYLEVMLGTGFIGFAVLVALVLATILAASHAFTTRAAGSSWTLAVAGFCMVANLQETFITGNHFLWMLLVAAIIESPRVTIAAVRTRPQRASG